MSLPGDILSLRLGILSVSLDIQSLPPGTESKPVDTPSVLSCTEWALEGTLSQLGDM